ncbi:glutathione peroxidase [Volvox carteri f. nagariensis]|uniref:Glutathione peroxidase n=1 Tax=Volvox carteri f. nagariensis TaxID=3068 RepID=D8TLV1_VOLCA|nr:glutathione peroxidase [Volvox carteri f. nagariensis]EFJ51396.1 glutathione peroxidase [Volvox carteri f. nagariensis]|eukprot:XP_002947348.1 glutathione peroxidase [Volvox carteri f. nagariensis]
MVTPALLKVQAFNSFRPFHLLRLSTMAAPTDFYSLNALTNKGETLDFSTLKGQVVLIVNVASQCGFTGQYSGLQQLYDSYKDRGFTILGFPCNQFGGQEPGSSEEIMTFCSRNYGVSFPIMAKVNVNGDDASPVYKFLKSQKKQLMMEMIKWNFEKFLINRQGEVVGRFSSMATPASIESEIQKLL